MVRPSNRYASRGKTTPPAYVCTMITGLVINFLLAIASANPILNIINGATPSEGQFPWQLVLTNSETNLDCGAVLIEPDVALTAGHCLGNLPSAYHIVGGQHNKEVVSDNEVTIAVASFTLHPDFDLIAAGYPNDIAVLHLSSSFNTEGAYIKTISLASNSSSDFAGTVCTVTGWGNTSPGGPRSPVLQYAEMGCITNSHCADIWTAIHGAAINNGHICVLEPGKTTCIGDSGGPMICDGVLSGIGSWQLSSCSDLFPTVYTRISYFREWIDNNK